MWMPQVCAPGPDSHGVELKRLLDIRRPRSAELLELLWAWGVSTSGCDEDLLYKLRSYSLSPCLAPVESTSMSWAGPCVRQHVYRGGCGLGKVRMGHPPPCVVRSFCGVVLRICVVVPAAFVGRCLARVARCNVLAAAASHCLRPCLSGGPRLAVWVVVGRQSPWACRNLESRKTLGVLVLP